MKVVKINALWCSGCLVMNKVWNEVLKEKTMETISLDYDIDNEEIKKYQVGNILPVFIFYKDEVEVQRVIGEVSLKKMLSIIEELDK